jgi:hypothetical protein
MVVRREVKTEFAIEIFDLMKKNIIKNKIIIFKCQF